MYIGSTMNLNARWQAHKWALTRGKHTDVALQSAWDSFGGDAFELVLVEQVALKNRQLYGANPELLDTERRWQIYLMEQGFELYNRTLPRLRAIPVVEWTGPQPRRQSK